MIKPFYCFVGGLYHPQTPATGSWNRAHQNGVAVGGLLASLIDSEPQPAPMSICRLTIDIVRAVPFQPVEAVCHLIKSGPRLQILEAHILADGELVARASAVRVRTEATPDEAESPLPYPSPDEAAASPITSVLSVGHPVETRVVMGSPREPGPGAYWTRINAEVVEGRPMSQAARAAMAADLASAPSSVIDTRQWSNANIDLSVYFTRAPVGDWVLAEAETVTAGNGAALVNTVLADEKGPFGRAHQTLFIAPRRAA